MKRINYWGILGLLALAVGIGSPAPVHALDTRYLRNGECYLLIGEGADTLRGVYRLNNPSLPKPAFYNPAPKVLTAKDILNTLGFDVDLNRVIYTFTEKTQSNWAVDTEKMYRQVLDGVSNNTSDYGYHSYIHYDHRGWGNGSNVYRPGDVNRGIKRSGSGNWSGFKGAGQGTPTSKPTGYTMPSMTGAAKLDNIEGKNWYKIPNKSWYSCWKTSGTESRQNGGVFYYVMGDIVKAKYHNYYLYQWLPKNIDADNPGYGVTGGGGFIEGSVVAQTKEEDVSRTVYAGCLDGCGGASGSGTAAALAKISDTAFQPPLKGGGNRTYFYSRSVGKTDGKILMNNTAYNPAANSENPLIGYPESTDTFWLCISLRDKASDYVYCCGTKTIKEWHSICTSSTLNNMNITAVCASNQWDQKGGIVYAYDEANKSVYKFERRDNEGEPLKNTDFKSYDVKKLLSAVGANTNLSIDDIGADGFGSLFFAISHPSVKINEYNPAKNFKPGQAIDIVFSSHDDAKKETIFQLLYKQDYGKVVFEMEYTTGDIFEIGRKNFATRYFTVTCKICDEGWKEIKDRKDFSTILTPLASWSARIAGNPFVSNWPEKYYLEGIGNFSESTYPKLNFQNPGLAKIAVINVPTPPKVLDLGGKKSYLDIIGPYSKYPKPDLEHRKTNQGENLLVGVNTLERKKLYMYMVENYPLEDGAQDPTAQEDYDGDGRRGGFISSVMDPNPKSEEHPDGIEYIWKTWMVMDLYGNPVCELVSETRDSYLNSFYYPVFGKFIMTCGVKYHWYDYDALEFGDTVDQLSKVLHKDEWALPVAVGAIAAQNSQSRLNEIKSMSEFSFMNKPVNKEGEELKLDYDKLIIGDCPYLAMLPFVCGDGIDQPPTQPQQVANISRCDEIPGKPESEYVTNKPNGAASDYWSSVPDGGFGIEAGMPYFWRIDLASQTNMFIDISKTTSTNQNDANYNYLAHMMTKKGSPYYVNDDPDFQFRNLGGDLRWDDENKIHVMASLIYKVPDGKGGFKEETCALIQGDKSSNFEKLVDVLPEESLFSSNSPIVAKTKGDLPPTDPFDARIEITMSRKYRYDMWAYDDKGQPRYLIKNILGQLDITGTAKVTIMDTTKPSLNLAKTYPNNLFGITGRSLTVGVGPSGKANPNSVSFTVTDNNPWEAIETCGTWKNLSFEQHLANYVYNNGSKQYEQYISLLDPKLQASAKKYGDIQGIRNQIAERKRNNQKSSDLNLKPVFSTAARDVRLRFQTAKRLTEAEAKTRKVDAGKVVIDSADTFSYGNNIKGYSFNSDDASQNFYAVHYRGNNGSKSSKYLKTGNMTFSDTVGGTTVYTSNVVYNIETSNIKIGANKGDNTIPECYANNTPGYAEYNGNTIKKLNPYKFNVRMIDSSGNFDEGQELNLVLNVKDDIPPIGYGSVRDLKDDIVSNFPYRNDDAKKDDKLKNDPSNVYASATYSPANNVRDSEYFALGLNDKLVRADWTPSVKSEYGYINEVSDHPYEAVMSLGDKISTAVKNDVFEAQVKNGITPLATEDNVECVFNVYVSDNCGFATATLTLKYFSNDGRGATQKEVEKSITSFYETCDLIATTTVCASGTNSLTTVFRGKTNQFPMAIPITITSVDDARDWDYYNGGTVDSNGNWQWGNIIKGANDNKTRVFKTSLPVYGSDLSIRTLDKTISNEN